MERSPLVDSGIALGVIAAFLYATSAAYDGGYFLVLKLDADVLDRNLQQVLFDGFLRLVGSTPALLIVLAYATWRILYAYVLFPSLVDYVRRGWSRKRSLVRLKRRLGMVVRKDTKREQEGKQRARRGSIVALGFIGAFFLLAHIESKGRDKALDILKRIESNAISDGEVVTVGIGGESRHLVYLTCGARNCAGIDPGTRVVYYFPQTGHSYVLPGNKGEQKESRAGGIVKRYN